MTVLFTPCPSGTDCTNETSINVLRYIFGEVIDSLATGKLPNTSVESGFLATMLHWFAIGMMTLVFVVLSWTILKMVNNARETGAWYGETWHPVWTPMRLLYSLFMAAPLKFGFAMMHIFILMIALWGIGLANYIYKVGVIDKAFISPQSSAYSTTDYGFKNFANQYFKTKYCAHLFNSAYAGTADVRMVFAGGSTSGSTGTPSYTQNYPFIDKGSTALGGGTPFCGVVSINKYNPSNFSIDSDDKNSGVYQALNNAQAQTQNAKNQATLTLMQQIDSWVNSLPTNDDPTAWSAVDTSQLNNFINVANSSVGASVEGVISGLNTSGVFDSYKENLKERGWASMGGWTGQVSSLMSRIVDIANNSIGGVSEPSWKNLPESAQIAQIKTVYDAAVPSIIKSAGLKSEATATDSPILPQVEWSIFSPIETANNWSNQLTVWLNHSVNSAFLYSITKTSFDSSSSGNATADICGTRAYLGHSIARLGCAGSDLFAASFSLSSAVTTAMAVAHISSSEILGNKVNIGPAAEVLLEPVASGLYWVQKEGGYLSVVIPMLPSVFLILAVVGFFIQILQSMIAATLWLVLHSMPDRSFIGSQMQGYLLLLSLLARPAMIVIGFIAALSLCDALLPYVTQTLVSSASKNLTLNGVDGLRSYISTLNIRVLFYCGVITAFLYLILGLPHTLFDQVFTWIGVNIHPLGESSANAGSFSRTSQNIGVPLSKHTASRIFVKRKNSNGGGNSSAGTIQEAETSKATSMTSGG